MDRLYLFENEEGFRKAVIRARTKGYDWISGLGYSAQPTFETILLSSPMAAKHWALHLFTNKITKKKEMQWQTRAFYLGKNGRKNITKYIIEEV